MLLAADESQPQVCNLQPGDAHLLQLGAHTAELVPDVPLLHGAPNGGTQAANHLGGGVAQLPLDCPLELVAGNIIIVIIINV